MCGQACEEGAAVGDDAVGSRTLDLQPVYALSVVAVAHGQAGHPAVAVGSPLGVAALRGAAGRQVDNLELLVDGRVAAQVGGEQELAAATDVFVAGGARQPK